MKNKQQTICNLLTLLFYLFFISLIFFFNIYICDTFELSLKFFGVFFWGGKLRFLYNIFQQHLLHIPEHESQTASLQKSKLSLFVSLRRFAARFDWLRQPSLGAVMLFGSPNGHVTSRSNCSETRRKRKKKE